MTIRPAAKTVAVAALCATVAAAAGIAGSSAKTSTKKGTNSSTQSGTPAHPLMRMKMLGGPVHAEVVVLNKAGTAWITMTEDNGTVSSVSGDQLVITEGTKAVPYKTVTLTIPADAKVIRNGKTAKLSDFVSGDHVHVMQSSEGTVVIGGDEKLVFRGPFGPGKGPKGGPMHVHPGGPGFPGPFGPPPAAGGSSSNGSDSGSSSSSDANS